MVKTHKKLAYDLIEHLHWIIHFGNGLRTLGYG